MTVVRETPASILLDAGNGLGHPVAKHAMEQVIAKAKTSGSAFGAVRNSNHYGIAGYYAMMALEHDLIGIASTNTVRYGAPTYGSDMLLGTNPFAYAIPAHNEPAFVLDFATTTVPRGKIEVYNRKEKPLNHGLGDRRRRPRDDRSQTALKGALLPLGGFGVDNGGHKGYGLGLLVEILCGVLSGGRFGLDLPLPSDGPKPGVISHFFGAIRIDASRESRRSRPTWTANCGRSRIREGAGQERIYVAGEIEHEKTLYNREHGVPVHVKVWDGLQKMAGELGIPFDL